MKDEGSGHKGRCLDGRVMSAVDLYAEAYRYDSTRQTVALFCLTLFLGSYSRTSILGPDGAMTKKEVCIECIRWYPKMVLGYHCLSKCMASHETATLHDNRIMTQAQLAAVTIDDLAGL